MVGLIAQALRDIGRVKQMFANPYAGISQSLRRNREGHEVVGVFDALIFRNAKTDFHNEYSLTLFRGIRDNLCIFTAREFGHHIFRQ